VAAWPVRNIRLKLVSVCIAGLLWMIVAGDRVVERVLRVPVELQDMPADLELVGPAPDTVDVRVRGSSNALTRLGPGDIAAVIDLKAVREGRRVFTLGPAQVLVPAGLETVQVSPSTIAMEFEATVTRRVPVEPRTDGEPERGFRVVRVVSVPDTVEVSGPASVVARVTAATTDTVSIEGRRDSVRAAVAVGVDAALVRIRGPQTVTVAVTIEAVKR
jgi:YbbR domain-containing protein